MATPNFDTDEFGDEYPTAWEWVDVDVFGWAINSPAEKADDSEQRLIDTLDLYLPVAAAGVPYGQLQLPDGSRWSAEGDVQNYEHNPWWSPGLLVQRFIRVRG